MGKALPAGSKATIGALILCAGLVLAVAGGAGSAQRAGGEIWPEDARVEIVQLGGDRWRVAYRLARPVRHLDLGPSLGGFRPEAWRVVSGDADIVSRGGRDYLEARPARGRFDEVAVAFDARRLDLVKHYEPVRPLGADGAIVYTGHFWPWRADGRRIEATFDLTPARGGRIAVLGRAAGRLERWRSDFSHPAFVYFGPLDPRETEAALTVVDPSAPPWIAAEFDRIAPAVFARLARVFKRPLAAKPDVFIAHEAGGPEGLLRYAGDALPGQFQLSLYGGGWRAPTGLARDLLHRAAAHEAVHLWQAAVNPLGPDVPGWIHEGAADAIAAETLRAVGLWDRDDVARDFERAQKECAAELDDGSLRGATGRGAVRALYACGQLLMQAAAGAPGGAGSAAAFWRKFAARAQETGGYDAELFFALVEEESGSDLAAEMRRFERTPFARPERAIAALLAESRGP